jgi:hypothetical protein
VEDKEPLHHAAFNDNGHVAQLLSLDVATLLQLGVGPDALL